MNINRRRFIRQTAQGAIALGSSVAWEGAVKAQKQTVAVAESFLPIVDTHQHLWDLSKLRLSWLKGDRVLGRSFVMRDYLEAIAGVGVVQAVYMEVNVDTDCQLAEAEYIVEICRKGDTPTAGAVIGGCPEDASFPKYITRFQGSPYVKGVRRIPPASPAGRSLYRDGTFIQSVRLLGELGMRFDLCVPPAQLPEAVRLVDACPGTRFILDHCGNADPKWFAPPADAEPAHAIAARRQEAEAWRRDIAELAKRDRVMCKISGIIARANKDHWKPDDLAPIVHHCLEVFGPERVMFASDWPVCTRVATLRQWVEALKKIVAGRSVDQQRKLFHDNAVRFYDLA